jgi:hypothetical protein
VSVRHEDAATLKQLLRDVDRTGQGYIEVTGPKGVGESTLINNVLAHKAGLVVVNVQAGALAKTIKDDARRAIGGLRSIGNSEGDAKRVLFFFKIFGARPTVLIRVRERTIGEKYAQITPETRSLADEGFRILLDASNNAIDPNALPTGREERLEMRTISFDVMLRDPVFKAAFVRLKGAGLDQMVWQTLGGVATDLDSIASAVRFADDDSIKGAVANLVQHKLENVIENIDKCTSDVKTKLFSLLSKTYFGRTQYISHCFRNRSGQSVAQCQVKQDSCAKFTEHGLRSKTSPVSEAGSRRFVLWMSWMSCAN